MSSCSPKDRRLLFQKAMSWRRNHKSAQSFEDFIREAWPTGIERIGEKTLYHTIAFVWDL